MDKHLKQSLSVTLHALSMAVLLLPLLWFAGGFNLPENEPVEPNIGTKLPSVKALL